MKFKPGDRVVPHDKTVWTIGLETSIALKRARQRNQPYLYVTGYESSDDRHVCCSHNDDSTGDYFAESDLTLYVEPINSVFNHAIINERLNELSDMKKEKVKPQTFVVTGPSKYLEAVLVNLVEIGFKMPEVGTCLHRDHSMICHNMGYRAQRNRTFALKDYMELWDNGGTISSSDRHFIVPQDIPTLIEFAENQLEIAKEYFKEELNFTVDQWFYRKLDTAEHMIRLKEDNKGIAWSSECYLIEKDKVNAEYLVPVSNGYLKNFRAATKEEILRVLSIVAEHKGFKEGVQFYPVDGKEGIVRSRGTCIVTKLKYHSDEDRLTNSGYWNIYDKGTWAEVVKDVTPKIKLGGYEAKFGGDYVNFGCKHISKDAFITAASLIRQLSAASVSIHSLAINGDGNVFSVDASTIIEIDNYFRSKQK